MREIRVGEVSVSTRVDAPRGTPAAVLLLAHGAGVSRDHPSMDRLAGALVEAGFVTARFNFPYRERGRKVPDRAPVLIETWREVFAAARAQGEWQDLPILAGGRSMGGRMASMAAAEGEGFSPQGLIFFAYPLHPPGKPQALRVAHLSAVRTPMLFLSGTRDSMATVDLMNAETRKLGALVRLHWLEGADHGFHVLKRSGRTDEDIVKESAEVSRAWLGDILMSR